MVSDALYFSDWFGAQEKFKQSMLLIMSRSTRHLEFTAGKFVPLVLATFVSVCVLMRRLLSLKAPIIMCFFSF